MKYNEIQKLIDITEDLLRFKVIKQLIVNKL